MSSALSITQERRLITHLDSALIDLSRHFETRRSPRAALPTLEAYLESLLQLVSLVLSIPPASNALRIAYFLQLTSLLAEALRGYPAPPSLNSLWTTFALLDGAWREVMLNREWDIRTNAEKGNENEAGEGERVSLRQVDRARLRSIISESIAALKEGVQGATFVPMKIDPFQEVLVPRLDEPTPTPSLVSDDDETDETLDDADEESDEEDMMDMEEVDIILSPRSRHNERILDSFDITFPPDSIPIYRAQAEGEGEGTAPVDLPTREPEWNDRSAEETAQRIASGVDGKLDQDEEDEEDDGAAIDLGVQAEIAKVFLTTRQMLEMEL